MRTTLAVAAALALAGGVAQAVPLFVEKFDERTTAPLNGQYAWKAAATGGATVQTGTVFGGTKAADVADAVLWRDVPGGGATDVWVDWYVRPARRTTAEHPTPGTNSSVAFYVNSAGHLVVLDDDEWTVLDSFTVPENAWTRLTARLNYTTKTWSLYACDGTSNRLARPLAIDLAFRQGAANPNTTVGKLRVTAAGASRGYLDSVTVGNNADSGMPLHIDEGEDGLGDGISDRWAVQYLGDSNNRAAASDQDSDGMTDREEYIAGTDPDDANAFLHVVDADLVDETSNDIEFRVSGGLSTIQTDYAGDAIGRTVTIRAADNDATHPKAGVQTVADALTGENALTDPGAAALYSARFYDVSTTFGGASCENTEEWAAHVQARAANRSYFICVPVNFGSDAENNFSGRLGEQLARGLFASLETGDVVRYWNANKVWETATVTKDDGGTVQWSVDSAPLDMLVTPGMALWVERSGEAAPRANAVFVGRSFTDATVANMTFTRTDSNWNMFGWPLPVARRNVPGGTGQLGFESVGMGGIPTGAPFDATAGDMIWRQEGNGWRYYMLLDNHAAGGEAYDGRWWGDGTGGGGFADFALEPGKAYYYYHTPNWESADFVWKPALP